jgi:bacteriocin-like protein
MKRLLEKTGSTLRELTERELEHVSGGKLQSANPGGQEHGASQITTTSGNDNAPPGQNKDLPPGLR